MELHGGMSKFKFNAIFVVAEVLATLLSGVLKSRDLQPKTKKEHATILSFLCNACIKNPFFQE